jgi:hypothetical protein
MSWITGTDIVALAVDGNPAGAGDGLAQSHEVECREPSLIGDVVEGTCEIIRSPAPQFDSELRQA